MITNSRLPPVWEILSHFHAKLSGAQAFLQNATTTIQQMTDQNRANRLKFQRHEVSHQFTREIWLMCVECVKFWTEAFRGGLRRA